MALLSRSERRRSQPLRDRITARAHGIRIYTRTPPKSGTLNRGLDFDSQRYAHLDDDLGGKLIEQLMLEAGNQVLFRRIVVDEVAAIRSTAMEMIDEEPCEALLVTGGTGLAARDCTTEAIEPLYDAMIPGYGELFRMLSFQEIGSASMLSRASGGRRGKKIILTMPGSPNGVRLAMERLIVPELAHLVLHAGK